MTSPATGVTTSVPAALSRLVLGWGFAAAAAWWMLSIQPAAGPAATVFGRQLTKADLPAMPLFVAGGLLSVLAVIGHRSRPATISTVLLCMFGFAGWLGVWWLAIEPTGNGAVIAPITPRHGISESDVVVIPTILVSAVCGLFGLLELLRSAAPFPSEAGDPAVPFQSLFGSSDGR